MPDTQPEISQVTPAVSVVIPCYNYGKYVLEAVDSCLRSTFQDLEILIVDDGSTDPETIALLDRLDRPKTRVVRQANKRMSGARNTGFREARGRYVLPLDADDVIHPTLIEKAVWVLETRPEVGFVSFWLKHFGDEDWIWRPDPFNFHQLLFGNSVTTTSLVRRNAWEQVGGYDESMTIGYEDWDFWIKLGEKGWVGHQIQEPVFYYRKHGVSTVTAAVEKHDLLVRQIQLNHPRLYSKASLRRLRQIWCNEPTRRARMKAFVLQHKPFVKRVAKRFVPPALRPGVVRRLKRAWDLVKQALGRGPAIHPTAPTAPLPPLPITPYHVRDTGTGKLKIMLIVPWLELGGADQVNLDIMSGLDASRYEVTVISTLPNANPWWERFNALTPLLYHLPNYLSDERWYGEAVCRLIEMRSIDLVLVSNSQHGFDMLPAIRERFPNLPIAALVHNYVPSAPTDYARQAALHDATLGAYVAITDSLKLTMAYRLGLSPDKIHVIENGVDLDRFRPREEPLEVLRKHLDLPAEKQIISFIGRLSDEKGALRFIRIAKHLSDSDSFDQRLFLVIGDGPQMPEVRALLDANHIGHKVRLLGSRKDVIDLLRASTLLIAPSQFEGLPIIGLEAMACGLPILASKVVGWTTLIEDGVNGSLHEVYDEIGFARKAETLLADPAMRQELGRNARQTVEERYSLQRFARQYQALFEHLVSTECERSRLIRPATTADSPTQAAQPSL